VIEPLEHQLEESMQKLEAQRENMRKFAQEIEQLLPVSAVHLRL